MTRGLADGVLSAVANTAPTAAIGNDLAKQVQETLDKALIGAFVTGYVDMTTSLAERQREGMR